MIKILFTVLCVICYYSENTKINNYKVNNRNTIKNYAVKSAKVLRRYIKNKQYNKHSIKPIQTAINLDIQEFTTPKKISVRFIPIKDTKITSIAYAVRNAGDITEKKFGINTCLSQLMKISDGKNLTNKEIQKISSIMSISVSSYFTKDDFIGEISFPQNRSSDAVKIITELMYNLDFKNSFNLAIEHISNNYLLAASSPEHIISKETTEAMFPAHSYGKTPTDSDFKKLTIHDAENAYKNLFSKDSLIVVIVGNISKNEAIELVDNMFGSIPEKKDDVITLKQVTPKNFKNIKLKKDNYNTNKILFILSNAPSPSDQEYIPIIIALQIFSMIPLDNKLINELRKKIGQVYYASFKLNCLKFSSYFTGVTESTNKDIVIKSIYNVVKNFQKYGITKYEFALAKNILKSNVIFSILSTISISEYMLSLWLNGMDKDYINNFFKILDCIEFEKVQSAIKKYFSINNLNIAVISGSNK